MTNDRLKDIATLKAHCSLLRGLPDRVVEELYTQWLGSPHWELTGLMWAEGGELKPPTQIEAFIEHCVALWSGEAS